MIDLSNVVFNGRIRYYNGVLRGKKLSNQVNFRVKKPKDKSKFFELVLYIGDEYAKKMGLQEGDRMSTNFDNNNCWYFKVDDGGYRVAKDKNRNLFYIYLPYKTNANITEFITVAPFHIETCPNQKVMAIHATPYLKTPTNPK
jgi:hypothetical protein